MEQIFTAILHWHQECGMKQEILFDIAMRVVSTGHQMKMSTICHGEGYSTIPQIPPIGREDHFWMLSLSVA